MFRSSGEKVLSSNSFWLAFSSRECAVETGPGRGCRFHVYAVRPGISCARRVSYDQLPFNFPVGTSDLTRSCATRSKLGETVNLKEQAPDRATGTSGLARPCATRQKVGETTILKEQTLSRQAGTSPFDTCCSPLAWTALAPSLSAFGVSKTHVSTSHQWRCLHVPPCHVLPQLSFVSALVEVLDQHLRYRSHSFLSFDRLCWADIPSLSEIRLISSFPELL